MIRRPPLLQKVRTLYSEYPKPFWILVLAMYVDMFGRSSVTLFLILFFTQRFGITLSKAGVLLLLFTVSAMGGRALGGALADRFGRRTMNIFGIVSSALSSLIIPFVPTLCLMYPVIVVAGWVSSIGAPARRATVVDLLPAEQRKEGFSILRVSVNLAWISGPIVGGFLFDVSYTSVFFLDAVTSLAVAYLVYRGIPETQPVAESARTARFAITLRGYVDILRARRFMLFLAPLFLLTLAYRQSFGPLSVFLRDIHQLPSWYLGVLFSFDGFLVVALQIWIIRRTRNISPRLMMAGGAVLYAAGLALFGFVRGLVLLLLAKGILVVGEMLYDPVVTAEAFTYAPDHMRARYSATLSIMRSAAIALAPILGGLVMEKASPSLVWVLAGAVALAAASIYLVLPGSSLPQQDTSAPSSLEG